LTADSDLGKLRKFGDVAVILTAGPLDTCGVSYTNALQSGYTFALVSKDCATGICIKFLQLQFLLFPMLCNDKKQILETFHILWRNLLRGCS
jgi:hypothetical protein